MSTPDWVETDPWTRTRDQLHPLDIASFSDEELRQHAMRVAVGLANRDIALREGTRLRSLYAVNADNSVHTATQVLGERCLRVAGLLLAAAEDRLTVWESSLEPLRDAVRAAPRAMTAAPYLWTNAIESEMNLSDQPPRHVISRSVLPEPRMWWTTESAFSQENEDGTKADFTVDATVISDEGAGFNVLHLGSVSQGRQDWQMGDPAFGGFSITYGLTYPDDFPPGARGAVGQVLTKLAFLNSPYVPKTIRQPGRAERKAALRLGDEALEDVTFVELRRVAPLPTGAEPEGDGAANWKHRWIVKGHYRAQWYPSESAHHVIYIAPYLKGPDDAPLLQHVYKVVR